MLKTVSHHVNNSYSFENWIEKKSITSYCKTRIVLKLYRFAYAHEKYQKLKIKKKNIYHPLFGGVSLAPRAFARRY